MFHLMFSSFYCLRYVDMQFQMWDKDDSGGIDFDEFIKLYAKMYSHPEGAEVRMFFECK